MLHKNKQTKKQKQPQSNKQTNKQLNKLNKEKEKTKHKQNLHLSCNWFQNIRKSSLLCHCAMHAVLIILCSKFVIEVEWHMYIQGIGHYHAE